MMGSHQSKMSSSSERESAQAIQVLREQISTKPEISSQPGAGVRPDQPNLQIMPEHAGQPATEGRQSGEGLRSMAEAAEEGTRGGSKQTERYGNVPSMAEAAEQPSPYSQTQHGGDLPSVAEMAEPLVGGGEPVPSAGPAEGTAARSIAEQADVDHEQAQQQKLRDELEAKRTAYRESLPEPVGGREMGREWPQQTQQQLEPSVSEPLALGGRPITQQRFVPDEQAKSGPQTYQRFEKSGEPVTTSVPSEKELGVGQTGTFEQQHPTGLAQGQSGELFEEAGEPAAPSLPSERNLGFILVGVTEQQQPTDLAQEQAGERFERSGESAVPSAPSEQEMGFGQTGAFEQQRLAGLAQGRPGNRMWSQQVSPPEPAREVESQQKSPQGKEIPITDEEEQAPRKNEEPQHPGYSQGRAEERPEHPSSAPELRQSGFTSELTTNIPIAGETEPFPENLGEQQRRLSAPELQEIRERETAFLAEGQANKLDKLISTIEPPASSPERGPEPISGEERVQQQPSQGEIFYAQGEGYKGPEGRQQRPPESRQQPQQQAFMQGEPSFGERNREQRLQQKRLPDQTSAEPRPTAGEGERFGRETPSVVPASVQGEAVPISNMSGLTSEFAKMQFPREGFHERTEAPLKREQEKREQEKQPGATSFETENEVIGVGAESGRPVQYEYLPHPADIQFHSWGSTIIEAFGNMADCMFNYLANTEKVDIEPQYEFFFEVIGEDDKDLLYKFLDELLFRFNTRKQIICKRVDIIQIAIDQDGLYRLYAYGHGEPYNAQKHGSGTEIKAITLASLQVNEQPERTDAYVIVDI